MPRWRRATPNLSERSRRESALDCSSFERRLLGEDEDHELALLRPVGASVCVRDARASPRRGERGRSAHRVMREVPGGTRVVAPRRRLLRRLAYHYPEAVRVAARTTRPTYRG